MAKNKATQVVTEPAEVEHAYLDIADYFDSEGYGEGIRLLNKLLKTAMSEGTTKENPASVLFYVKALKGLTAAVVLIQKTGHRRSAAILVPPDDGYPDLSRLADFSRHHCIPLWETFPRMLSEKEYFNPYIVFKKVSRFGDAGEWAYILDEVFDYCFYESSLAENSERYNVVTLQRLLQKLIEACYLVVVRTTKDAGAEKPAAE